MPNTPNEPIDVPGTSRRVVLMGAAVTVAGGALAACSSGNPGSVTVSDTGTAAAGAPSDPATDPMTSDPASSDPGMATTDAMSPTGTAAAAPMKPAAKNAAAKAAAAKSAAKGALAKLSSIPVGGSIVTAGVVIARPTRSRVVGHSATCTHEGCMVASAGTVLNCPCHGAKFDAFTGAVQAGPAPTPLPGVRLVVKAGYIHRA